MFINKRAVQYAFDVLKDDKKVETFNEKENFIFLKSKIFSTFKWHN